LELLAERQDERIRHMRRTFAGGPQSGDRDVALEQEARDATRSLKQSREWRLLLFEFVAHAARTPDLAPKLREQERRFRAALGELLGERLDQRGVTPSIPKDQVAVATLAIANGLAFEEMSDPGAVPDGLLGELLALLVSS
jgi:hypothetical protein